MTTSLAEFSENLTPLKGAPKEWQPRMEQDATGGYIVTKALPVSVNSPDGDQILIDSGLDPKDWVVTSLRRGRWTMASGTEGESHRATFVPRTVETPEDRKADIEELKALFKKKPTKTPTEATGQESAVLLVASDWQIGKGEGGGTAATVDRIRQSFVDARVYIKALKKQGHNVTTGVLAGTGDLPEGCTGFYPMQEWQTDLNFRDQDKVIRRLLREGSEMLADELDSVVVTGVGGNHGEYRKDGKAFTDFADNRDVAVLEVLSEIFAGRPGYEHVSFEVPDDELAIVKEIAGVNVGFAHGHQFGGGDTAQKKAKTWWANQAFGFQPLAQAQILISGHYHHFSSVTYGHRTHFQAPSMDGGSLWFKNQTGDDSPTGTLIMRVTQDNVYGWDNLRIL